MVSHVLLKAVGVIVMLAVVPTSGWDVVGGAMLKYNVLNPSVFVSTSLLGVSAESVSPFAPGGFGLPIITLGQSSPTGSRSTLPNFPFVAQRFFPLETTIASEAYNVSWAPNPGAPDAFGPGEVVTLSNGTALRMSMCGQAAGSLASDGIVHRIDPSELRSLAVALELTEVWRGGYTAVNASCHVLYVPFTAENQTASVLREFVAIVGGYSAASSTSTVAIGVSLFDPLTATMHQNAFVISLYGATDRTKVGGDGSVALCLLHPKLVVSSDGKLCIVGGVTAAVNTSTSTVVSQNWNRMILAVSVSIVVKAQGQDHQQDTKDIWQITFREYTLAPLPDALVPRSPTTNSVAATAMIFFQNSIYYSLVETGTLGAVGMLSLSHLMTATQSGSQDWLVMTLNGKPFDRTGSSFLFVPLQREGCVLGLFAIGGVANASSEAQPSITFTIVDTSYIPQLLMVPFSVTRGVHLSLVDNETLFGYDIVNISVEYELIGVGVTGYLALATHNDCQDLVSPVIEYDATIDVQFEWFEEAGTVMSQLCGRHLYLCYSNGETVIWDSTSGNSNQSILFTSVNPFEPSQLPPFGPPPSAPPSTPAPSRSTPSHVKRFFENNWFYFVIGVLGALSVAAVVISVRAVKQRLSSKSVRFGAGSPLMEDGSDIFHAPSYGIRVGGPLTDPLRISTNSHSSRYTTISALTSMDGVESDVTFLVQRKRDGVFLVMKYIVCDGDVERLLSIREFEALNMLQGHPNVVSYVDMFMNYVFSHTRLGRSHDHTAIVADALDRTESTLATSPRLTPQVSSTLNSDVHMGASGSLPSKSALLSPRDGGAAHRRSSSLSSDQRAEGQAGGRSGRSLTTADHRYVCLVMEYMPHGNVAQWLLKQAVLRQPFTQRSRKIVVEELPPAPEQLILSIAMQVCSLLKYMHTDSEVTLAHKGLKPENVLISGPCNSTGTFVPVSVSDFGFSVLGNYAPPSRLYARRRESNELEGNSDCGSRSSMQHSMDPTAYLQSPKCDMWCFGCLLYSLCSFKFGQRFPFLAEVIGSRPEKSYLDIRSELRERGYSRELIHVILLLLHTDEKLRPSSEYISKMFVRCTDGSLSLSIPK